MILKLFYHIKYAFTIVFLKKHCIFSKNVLFFAIFYIFSNMKKFYDNFNRIYFSGVLGVSMSGLCKHALVLGKTVGGSDLNVGNVKTDLADLGIALYRDNLEENISAFKPDALVYTSAIYQSNQEIRYAIEKGIPFIKRSVFLNECIKGYKKRIGVCGSHGKTTTTAMLAHCLINEGLDPTVFLGGEDTSFGNYRYGKGDLALVEACEYQKNFLDIDVNYSIVLNIDNDHLESYKGMDEMVKAFNDFSSNGLSVINADDENSKSLCGLSSVTFGINNQATYMAKKISYNGKGYSFSLFRNGVAKTRIELAVEGKHNIYNALSVCAMADILGISLSTVKETLKNFSGVKRRMEKIGYLNGIECITDYAHHPREIKATLEALKQTAKNDLIIFQPHTYSRTKMLLEDFTNELKKADKLIIYKTYPARESYDVEGSSDRLFVEIKKSGENKVYHAEDEKMLKECINQFKNQIERIVFLGAGDIYSVANKLVEKNI